MEPGETDEDVANVTIEDVSDDIVRQRVDQALARPRLHDRTLQQGCARV